MPEHATSSVTRSEETEMHDTHNQLLADAYTWYSTGLRDRVQDLLDETGLATGSDTVDDICGELWLHAAEFTATRCLSFTEVLDLLDWSADVLVNRLRNQPAPILAGRLGTAADPADIAEVVTNAVGETDYRPAARPQRPATTSFAFAHLTALRSAA
ncbi:hypothetical protein [Kitasatospora sp. NPDC017646]|uniref:hypothetical protein n=1 Tax=Kitasatospora sp. NPDC017646 TaxID=3364024 RepID=UPI00378B9F41